LKTIGVIAGGPSCTAEDARALCAACDETIAVNDSYRLAPVDHLYAADYRWYAHHIADITRDFEGQLWTQHEGWVDNSDRVIDPAQWRIKALKGYNRSGFSRNPGEVHHGSNSGYQAINLACHFLDWKGRIILIGFDMGHDGEQKHWFGDHPYPMNVNSPFDEFIELFNTIKLPEGIEVINCSRRTALDCFPRMDLDECLASL